MLTKQHTVAVVPESRALDEATRMGFQRFRDADTTDDPLGAVEHFTETAEYANNVLPSLRALAGYVDSGPGTYTVERSVVVVSEGDESDLPRDAREMAIGHVLEAVVDAWREGALDALEGRDAPGYETSI